MNLRLEREDYKPGGVHGRLFIDHTLLCVTLEDPTLYISPGSYTVTLHVSPKFHALLPLIAPVPGRSNILIHAGNRDEDTEGCVLVGSYRVDDASIAESRIALDKVLMRWRDWEGSLITVTDA